MPRFLRIGRVSLPQLASSHVLDRYSDGSYAFDGDEAGDLGISDRVRRMFRRPVMRPSVAAARRATGDPKWFMSAPGPGTSMSGALFVDTDGYQIRDGDGF